MNYPLKKKQLTKIMPEYYFKCKVGTKTYLNKAEEKLPQAHIHQYILGLIHLLKGPLVIFWIPRCG